MLLFEDYVTQEAAKILRLLHIRELRELQTLANEAIIAVQSLTANPKTDTKLGKVGIWRQTVYQRHCLKLIKLLKYNNYSDVDNDQL